MNSIVFIDTFIVTEANGGLDKTLASHLFASLEAMICRSLLTVHIQCSTPDLYDIIYKSAYLVGQEFIEIDLSTSDTVRKSTD